MVRSSSEVAAKASPVRFALLGALVVVILVIIAVVALQLMRSSRNQPINYDVYPNAAQESEQIQAKYDVHTYSTSDSPQQVLAFYQQKIGNGENRTCVETPDATGGIFGRCIIDNSQDEVAQNLEITIMSPNAATNKTQIVVARSWGG
jgi:hypothetical protein